MNNSMHYIDLLGKSTQLRNHSYRCLSR